MREAFEKFGKLTDCRIARQPGGGTSRGYGFVTFEDPRDAEDALERYSFAAAGTLRRPVFECPIGTRECSSKEPLN